MKEYYVYTCYKQWIVLAKKAKNEEEAINKIYEKCIIPIKPCPKKELKVKSIEMLHKENGEIVRIN